MAQYTQVDYIRHLVVIRQAEHPLPIQTFKYDMQSILTDDRSYDPHQGTSLK